MPRLAAIFIATFMMQASAVARADDSLAAPRNLPNNDARQLQAEPRYPTYNRPAPQSLANDILAPRSAVHHADHQAPASNAPPNQLAPTRRDIKTLALPAAPDESAQRKPASPLPGMGTVIGGLCLVLGLFFLVAWMMRKALPRSSAALPSEVAQPLGRILLAPRHYAHLIRIGNKLLLVSISQSGAETLSEITDPLEVDRLAGLCEQSREHSSTNAFRQVFEQFATQKAPRGFLGNEGSTSRELADVHSPTRERTHG